MATILTRNVKNHFNAKTNKITIYSPKGAPVETTRLNARDLCGSAGFTWAKPTPVAKEGVTPSDTEVAEATPEETFDPKTAMRSLKAMSQGLGTGDDVSDFLKGYTLSSLRALAAERYQHTLHPRTQKAGAVTKVMALEEVYLNSLPDWFEEPEDDSIVVVATPLPETQPTPGELEATEALVAEDGTGLPNATSYVSVAEAEKITASDDVSNESEEPKPSE